MPTFIQSAAIGTVAVNIDECISIQTLDVVDSQNTTNNEYSIIFIKADQNGAGTPIVWNYGVNLTARNATYAAIDTAYIANIV